jgi:hypothetical protein
VRPYRVALAWAPLDLAASALAAPSDDPFADHLPPAPQIRARTRVRDLGHHGGQCRRTVDAAHDQVPHHDVRGAVRLVADPGRTRSGPDRQLRGSDRQFRGGDVWRGHEARIPRRRVAPRLLEVPPSARARPPAARHTGRAALPSATFPHSLPGDPQIPGPSGSAQHIGGIGTGIARLTNVINPPLWTIVAV